MKVITINEIREWFEDSWSSSSEINIAELKDYLQRITITIPTLEDQNKYLNSDAPIIKSKFINEPVKAEIKVIKSNIRKLNEPLNNGDFYINIGEGKHRNWDDCRRCGFISGGSEKKYSRTLRKLLFPGSRVFVNIPKTGYVGIGLVISSAVPLKDFKMLLANGQQVPILDVPLVAPEMDEYVDDPDKSEYLVRIEWIKTVPRSQAYWEKGFFANQNTVCQMKSMKSRFTIKRLSQYFGLDD